MNERGVESPMVHNARGGDISIGHIMKNKWSEGSLRRILDCTAYDGLLEENNQWKTLYNSNYSDIGKRRI